MRKGSDNIGPMAGAFFLYSTSPSPHEATILGYVGLRAASSHQPISAVALRAAQDHPSEDDLAQLRRHFCTQGIPVSRSRSSGAVICRPISVKSSGLGSRRSGVGGATYDRCC